MAVRREERHHRAPAGSSPVAGAEAAPAAPLAVDPICGMTVAAVATTPSHEHDGETITSAARGASGFVAQHDPAGGGDDRA